MVTTSNMICGGSGIYHRDGTEHNVDASKGVGNMWWQSGACYFDVYEHPSWGGWCRQWCWEIHGGGVASNVCDGTEYLQWRSGMLVMAFSWRAVLAAWIEFIIGELEVRVVGERANSWNKLWENQSKCHACNNIPPFHLVLFHNEHPHVVHAALVSLDLQPLGVLERIDIG
jgi:hypothetical protein